MMKVEDLAHEEASVFQWKSARSPERATSLLPPFGAGQPSHLPTPQSPGNLINYLSGPTGSPLSFEHHSRPGSRYFPTRPPSRSASAHPPKTPQQDSSASTSQNFFYSSSSQDEFKNVACGHSEEDPARLNASQIATPSPEVTRTRRASVPNTPSDSETMLATPQVGRRSSSQPYFGPTNLAPAPVISPAISNHSTLYHASPDFDHQDLPPARTYNFSRGMAALVSEHNIQTAAHDREDREYYDLADPFVVREEEDRGDPPPRQRYPSPSPSKQHRSVHGNTSPLLDSKTGARGLLDPPIAKLMMSPSEFSETPSHGSPVKAEVEDGDYIITTDASRSLIVDGEASSRAPTSPRTPPVRSRRGSMSQASALEASGFQTPPPVPGGEIERIRQRQVALEETRIIESEKRRPEYMVRAKRARDNAHEETIQRERGSTLPGLGVTVSPFKGRRLMLYQQVAAADVVLEDHKSDTDEPAEPKTPLALSTLPTDFVPPEQFTLPSMSLRAIDWRTPGRGRFVPITWTEEDEVKKQRRLQAFAAPRASRGGRLLRPVETAEQGRILIDITSDETRALVEAGIIHMSELPETTSVENAEPSMNNSHGAAWPDNEYPWSVQGRQRDEYEELERRRRLAWIERFLDRESESEDEDNECVAGPSNWNQTSDGESLTRPRRGHGKSVSLNAIPNFKRSKSGRRMSFGAANADAREVLLSKRHVRLVAERVRKRKVAEEEEGVVMCICQGADDGRPMVRCDECRTWYHLICMDIQDEAELGDQWYCWKCLPSAEDFPPAPMSEPTFAPAMPESPPRAGVGDLPLYQSTLQPSPMPASPVVRRKRDGSPAGRSRFSHSLGDSGDPVHGGPSTPYHARSLDSRLYSTPKFYDEYAMDEHVPFDPTSTPSRGLKFPNPVPITPRRTHNWTPAQALSWTTPSGPPRTPQYSLQGGSSFNRSLTYSLSTIEDSVGPLTSPWPSDESPVPRPHKGAESPWPYPPQRMLDSPLTMRSAAHRPFRPGLEDSPKPRYAHKSKDRDIGEFASRTGRGKSPPRD